MNIKTYIHSFVKKRTKKIRQSHHS